MKPALYRAGRGVQLELTDLGIREVCELNEAELFARGLERRAVVR